MALSILIRNNLSRPNPKIIGCPFNAMITGHSLMMIFFMVIPALMVGLKVVGGVRATPYTSRYWPRYRKTPITAGQVLFSTEGTTPVECFLQVLYDVEGLKYWLESVGLSRVIGSGGRHHYHLDYWKHQLSIAPHRKLVSLMLSAYRAILGNVPRGYAVYLWVRSPSGLREYLERREISLEIFYNELSEYYRVHKTAKPVNGFRYCVVVHRYV